MTHIMMCRKETKMKIGDSVVTKKETHSLAGEFVSAGTRGTVVDIRGDGLTKVSFHAEFPTKRIVVATVHSDSLQKVK